RNFGVGMSFIASLVALTVVAAISAYIPTPALTTLAGLGVAAAKGLVSLATYHAVKEPIHRVANALFDLDKETAHDRIISLGRDRLAGKIITPEQILGVFAKANPRLDRLMEYQYGNSYDKLSLEDKQKAVEEMGKQIPIMQLVHDVN